MRATAPALDLDPAIEKKLVGWFAIVLITILIMAGAAIQNNSRLVQHVEWARHTHSFISETDAILSSLNAAEAAERTFLLTGDETARKVTAEKFAVLNEHHKAATNLAFDDPAQLDRLGAISDLMQKRIDLNKEAIRLMAKGSPTATKLLTNPDLRADGLEIERRISESRVSEQRSLSEREETLQRQSRRTEQILYAGVALNALLLGLIFYVLRLDLRTRRNAAQMLESRIHDRTVELEATNEKLQIENIEQKWGQSALQRIVNHHELVLNSIQDGIFVISRNGHIISANPAAANLALRESKQLAGKSITSLLVNGVEAKTWQKHFLAEAVKDGRALSTKGARLRQANGSIVPVQVACHPTRDRENLTGAVITVRGQWPMQ